MDSWRLFCRWLKLNLSVNDSRGADCRARELGFISQQFNDTHLVGELVDLKSLSRQSRLRADMKILKRNYFHSNIQSHATNYI